MPSLVTSVIGGLGSAKAATNAAKQQKEGYINANETLARTNTDANAGVQSAVDYGRGAATTAATDASAGVRDAAGTANARLDPYATTGAAATKTLGDIYAPGGSGMKNFSNADMQDDDGYAFRLQQGQQALDRSASAHGTLGGGAAIKGLTDYAQGAASQEYQSAFDRYQKQNQDRVNNLNTLSKQGMDASTTQGGNDVGAGVYAGNAGVNAAQYGGNIGMQGANIQSANTVGTGIRQADNQVSYAGADANGILGRQASFNGMLSGIGTAANSAITGGFGGGGFSTLGAITGVPRRATGGPAIGTNWGDASNMAFGG